MKDRRFIRAFLALSLAACSGASPRPHQGGEKVVCPDGTASAGTTIRTVNCSTVVQYDGEDLETSVDIPGLANAGMKNADKVLRQVNDAATDAQIQFTQTCEMYNACGLTSAEYDAALLRASGEQPGGTDQVATAMVDLFAAGAPECQGQTRGLEVAEPSGCSSMSRGLTPTASDDADFFGEQSSLAAQTVPGDDVILRTFSFVHVQ